MFHSLKYPDFEAEDVYTEFLSRIENADINGKDKIQLQKFVKLLQENKKEEKNKINKNILKGNDINLSVNKLWKYLSNYSDSTFDRLPSNGRCPICGLYVDVYPNVPYQKKNMQWSIDHVKPKSIYLQCICEPRNLVRVCRDCNGNKENWHEDITIIFNPYSDKYPNLVENIEIKYFHKDKNQFNYQFKLSDQNSDLITKDHHKNYDDIYKVGSSYREYTENYISENFINPLERLSDHLKSKEDLINLMRRDINEKLYEISSDTIEGLILIELLNVILNNLVDFVTTRKEFNLSS